MRSEPVQRSHLAQRLEGCGQAIDLGLRDDAPGSLADAEETPAGFANLEREPQLLIGVHAGCSKIAVLPVQLTKGGERQDLSPSRRLSANGRRNVTARTDEAS